MPRDIAAELRRDSRPVAATTTTAVDGQRASPFMTLPTPDPAFRWSAEPWGARAALPAARSGRATPVYDQATGVAPAARLDAPRRPTAIARRPTAAVVTADERLALAAASIGADVEHVMRVKQVHGRTVRVLRRGEARPRTPSARPEADAQVSNDPRARAGGAGGRLRAAADGGSGRGVGRGRARRVARHRCRRSPARRSRR